MKPIIFKFKGGQPKNVFNTPHGNFAVGDKMIDEEGNILLSPDCRTIGELRGRAEYLKKLIDDAVLVAEVQLPA
jgi:hypothetical protein